MTHTVCRYKWTVNYKFVSEGLFVSPQLSLALLACTVGTMALFLCTRWASPRTADAYAAPRPACTH
jgi:hypothetical protein